MLTLSDVDALTEFFLKDGTTLMKQYADGKRSAHFEHSIAIIDGKPVILSLYLFYHSLVS